MDEEKPSTKHLVFKHKEVVPTDVVSRPGDGTAISVQLIHQQNRLAEEKSRERRRTGALFPSPAADPEPDLLPIFKPKAVAPMDPPSPPGDEEAIHVPDILLENRIAEEQSGWGRIRFWKRRKSGRNRDCLLVVGSLDMAVFVLMRVYPGEISLVYGIGAIAFLTSVICWVMLVVVDDY